MIAALCFGTPDASNAQRPKIYKPQPGACYVQLRPTWPEPPYAEGGDQPVCRAVLANLNKFCDQPPQYDHRFLAPTTTNLREPPWKSLDPAANLDLVRQAFTATSTSPQSKADYWRGNEKRLTALARSGVLRLKTADIDIDSDGQLETVYMLENSYSGTKVLGSNSPIFVVADHGQRVQSEKGRTIGTASVGDLWLFDNRWYSIGFDFYKKQPGIIVDRITHYYPSRLGAVTDCTIQHTDVYNKEK